MTNKTKKLSYLSVILLVIGGTIGAGIFFKNKSLNGMAQGDFGIVMATWGVAIIGMLSLAVALFEITSAQKTNKGMLEWTKLFTPAWFHKTSSNYIKWILIPISLFTMPLYVVNALEDAGMNLNSNIESLGVAFGIFMWLFITNAISIKFGNGTNWITTILQIAPLIVLPIIGMIHTNEFSEATSTVLHKDMGEPTKDLMGTSPWLAVLGGIGAIAFAFDGFYQAAAVKNEMQNPEKNSKALVMGVLLISLFYIFVTLGFQLAGNGNVYGLFGFMPVWTFKLMNALIAIGILGIVNAWAMWTPTQLRDMTLEEENVDLRFSQKIFGKTFKSLSKEQVLKYSPFFWMFTLTFVFFVVLGLTGSFAYADGYSDSTDIYREPSSGSDYARIYGGGALYTFADVITNYTSLLVFIILAVVVIYAMLNRKTNKVSVKQHKLFIPAGIIFVAVFMSSQVYYIVEALYNIVTLTGEGQVSAGINFSVMVAIAVISITPAVVSEYNVRRRARLA